MSVSLEMEGLERLQDVLTNFSRFRADFRKKLPRAVMREQKKLIRERITKKKRGPDGETWAPWSLDYAKTRKAGNSLLIGRRKLVNSFRVAATAGKATLGSSLPYAAAQHFGLPGRNLPARPYFGVGKEDARQLDDLITAWVKERWP